MEWMLMPLSRYAEFSGRSGRREYWMYSLFQAIVVVGFAIAFFAIFGLEDNFSSNGDAVFGLVFAIVAYLLIFLVPSISVTVRRFHDQGLSGWLYFVSFIPYVGSIILIVFMCLPGSSGANKYGDPIY